MLFAKLKDRILYTIIRQRSRAADIVEYVTNATSKWAGHIARIKDNRRTIRSKEWQMKSVRSVGRPQHRWIDVFVGQQGTARTGQQRTKKVGGLWRRTTSCRGRTQPKIEQCNLSNDCSISQLFTVKHAKSYRNKQSEQDTQLLLKSISA